MQPFQEAVPIVDDKLDAAVIELLITRHGKTREEAFRILQHSRGCKMYKNDVYQVSVFEENATGFPEMIHLSIKRIDKEPVHDWRDLQEIKNQIVGVENEAVELYPAESRLVDCANQYHLWVLKNPTLRFPFGFNEGRQVGDSATAQLINAKQRDRS